MRVLHIYKDYYPVLGGIENHVRLLAEEEARRGLEVTVLVTSPTPRTVVEEANGVRIIKAARLATVASTPLSLGLFLWVRRLQADIAHLHFPYPPGEVANLLLGQAPHTVITYHSDVVRQKWLLRLYRPLLWRVLCQADRIIATSPLYIESSPFLRAWREKCVVIPLGIDLTPFQRVDERRARQLRRRYGGEKCPLILFVGKLRYYKGLQYLIEAMKTVEARLLVAGTGPMEGTWRRLTEREGLAGKVLFLGQVPDDELPPLYRACDLFVLPASERSEAFGAVLLEAMASGLPVVSTELGTGTSYVNRDGETGLVVPPRDPQALAQALRTLLADGELRRQMGERGREWARRFSKEGMAQAVIRLYASLLNPAGHESGE